MARTYSIKYMEWVQQEQGKHLCACGCGQAIEIKPRYMNGGIPKYVKNHSPKSRETKHRPKNTEADFWDNVKIGEKNQCWEWQGGKCPQGYGNFRYGPKKEKTHRLSYVFTYGSCEGWDVLHTCDNPPCCNPHHLELGTQLENMRGAAIRGRINKKYDKEDIMEVRGESKTLAEWAEITGIASTVIGQRIDNGWTVEESLTVSPVVGRNQTWRD